MSKGLYKMEFFYADSLSYEIVRDCVRYANSRNVVVELRFRWISSIHTHIFKPGVSLEEAIESFGPMTNYQRKIIEVDRAKAEAPKKEHNDPFCLTLTTINPPHPGSE